MPSVQHLSAASYRCPATSARALFGSADAITTAPRMAFGTALHPKSVSSKAGGMGAPYAATCHTVVNPARVVVATNATKDATATTGGAMVVYLAVFDPQIKGGKVNVELEKTLPTKGRADWLAGKNRRDLSVCCLFHQGRCHAADKCHQVHVDRDTLQRLREAMKDISCCCRECGDVGSKTEEAKKLYQKMALDASGFGSSTPRASIIDCAGNKFDPKPSFSVANFAYTRGLDELIDSAKLSSTSVCCAFPADRVCKLHLRGCCKYGRDCRHLHMCQSLRVAFDTFVDLPRVVVVGAATAATGTIHTAVGPTAADGVSSTQSVKTLQAVVGSAGTAQLPATPRPAVPSTSLVAKPLLKPTAPAFLRANYPTLDIGSLRSQRLPGDAVSADASGVDRLEITFRPFDHLSDDISPSYLTINSPASTTTADRSMAAACSSAAAATSSLISTTTSCFLSPVARHGASDLLSAGSVNSQRQGQRGSTHHVFATVLSPMKMEKADIVAVLSPLSQRATFAASSAICTKPSGRS